MSDFKKEKEKINKGWFNFWSKGDYSFDDYLRIQRCRKIQLSKLDKTK
ncbi:MAG: hypothetical protein ACXAC7_23210 [Candidatus Hodarchaeales archaeon]|jgi:hypothetical protein